ncbi:hypothetical protein J2P12_08035 [Candidatus Bathyarchaeota archaeon]|nr:hypothetical protein [Candidatus Bathyarchaeota archaeon]
MFPEAAKSREPVRSLNSEDLSPKVEDEPIEELRLMARPLKKEVANPNESVIDVKYDPCPTRLEDKPSEPVRFLVSPLI